MPRLPYIEFADVPPNRIIHNQQKCFRRSQKMISILSSGKYLLISDKNVCFCAYYQNRILPLTLLFESGQKEAVLHLTLNQVAKVVRRYKGPSPKSLENFKPHHDKCTSWKSLVKKVLLGVKKCFWAKSALLNGIFCILY